LVLLALLRWNVLFLLLGENVTLGALRLGLLGATEVGIVDVFGHLYVLNVDLGARSDDIALRNATQRAGVEAEGSIDQQEASLENLQQDNTFSLVTTSQENQNTARSKGFACVAHMLAEVVVGGALAYGTLGRQVGLVLLDENNALATILGTADFLHHGDGHLRANNFLGLRCCEPVQALALILGRSRPTRNSIAQIAVVVMTAGLFCASRSDT